jgi:hypothetical protein
MIRTSLSLSIEDDVDGQNLVAQLLGFTTSFGLSPDTSLEEQIDELAAHLAENAENDRWIGGDGWTEWTSELSDQEWAVHTVTPPDRDMIRTALAVALAPVLDDLASTCAVRFEVHDPDSGTRHPTPDGYADGWVWAPDGTGTGIRIEVDAPLADRVADTADRVQDAAIEALWYEGLSPTWPECPRHPNSHPLEAVVVLGRAVWRCPSTTDAVAEVGKLGA